MTIEEAVIRRASRPCGVCPHELTPVEIVEALRLAGEGKIKRMGRRRAPSCKPWRLVAVRRGP